MAESRATVWLRSTYCANNTCIEVAFLDNEVAIRDSKNVDGLVLRFTPAEWSDFVAGVQNGDFGQAPASATLVSSPPSHLFGRRLRTG